MSRQFQPVNMIRAVVTDENNTLFMRHKTPSWSANARIMTFSRLPMPLLKFMITVGFDFGAQIADSQSSLNV